MQDIDLVLMHAFWQFIVHGVAQSVGDRGQLLLPDQIVVDAVLVLKRVIIHAQLRRDQISDCLRVLARDNRVIKLEVVQCLTRVLKVELDQLQRIREAVDRHLLALADRDEAGVLVVDAVPREESQWTHVLRQCFLILEVHRSQPTHLHIEELGCVEHGLLLLSRHLIEEVGVVRVLH